MGPRLETDSVRAFVAANGEIRSYLAHDPEDPRIGLRDAQSIGAREILRFKITQLLEETGQSKPPVNLYRLASRMGIRRIVRSDIQVDGRILRCGSSYDIELCSGAPRRRQRFSLAHELTHTFFLDFVPELVGGRNRDRIEQSHWKAEELLCNFGAAEMLMPAGPFLGDAISVGPSIEAVSWLGQRWDVSFQSCLRRLCELNAWPTAFFRVIGIGDSYDVSNPIGLPSWPFSLAENRRAGKSRIGSIINKGTPWLGHLRLALGGPSEEYLCQVNPAKTGNRAQVMIVLHPDGEQLCKRSKLAVWSRSRTPYRCLQPTSTNKT